MRKLNDSQISKVKYFVNDSVMYETVMDIILDSYLKPRPNADVNIQAALKLAIDQLGDAKREFESFRVNLDTKPRVGTQPGL